MTDKQKNILANYDPNKSFEENIAIITGKEDLVLKQYMGRLKADSDFIGMIQDLYSIQLFPDEQPTTTQVPESKGDMLESSSELVLTYELPKVQNLPPPMNKLLGDKDPEYIEWCKANDTTKYDAIIAKLNEIQNRRNVR